MLFYVVQGYPDGRVRGKVWDQLPSFCRCLFLLSYNLHVQCKHLNSGGGGCGVAEDVIAKSLLQKTEKTPECISETIRKHC